MQHYSAVSLFLLVLQFLPAFAKNLVANIDLSLHRRDVDHGLERAAWVVVDKGQQNAEKRADPITRRSTVVHAVGSPVADPAFDQAVTEACNNAVSNYPAVVNPSGLVACYNVAFFNNSTGSFQTDVRLYQKSDPAGAFVGMQPSDYTLSMSIPDSILGALTMLSNGSIAGTQPANGQFLAGFQNLGQLSETIQYSMLTDTDLRVMMIPDITIAVPNTPANTTLSSDTLSYVAGRLVQPDGTPTNITFPDAAVLAAPVVASVSKFILPGTRIMVFPTGLIITCVWTGLFSLAVGLGTVGRYRFRQHYRRRMELARVSGKL